MAYVPQLKDKVVELLDQNALKDAKGLVLHYVARVMKLVTIQTVQLQNGCLVHKEDNSCLPVHPAQLQVADHGA